MSRRGFPAPRYNGYVVFGLLGLALLALQAPAPASPAVAPQGRAVSWDLAESLLRKLEALERRGGKPARSQTVVVTEGELNSYLNLSLGPKMPPGVSDVDVALATARVAVKALVDLEQVKGKMPATGTFNPVSYLSGRVPVELKGRFRNGQDGFGSLELEEARLGGLSVPLSLVEQLVVSLTRTGDSPHGFDIHAPFRLPYSVRRLRLQPGRALLDL